MQEEKQKRKEAAAAALADPSPNDFGGDQSSDEDSDSGESEDNLDADQLKQIMPKKIIKKPSVINGKKKKGKGPIQVPTKKLM